MLALLAFLLVVLVAACSGASDAPAADGTPGADDAATGAEAGPAEGTAPSRDVRRPTITLGVTDWTAARLNVAIAEILIERRLGHPVEAVPVLDMGPMLADLEAGRLDAVLELWPSGLIESERQAIEDGPFADLGLLGVEGKVGWWVPRYVAEGELGVTDWEALAEPDVARAFAGDVSPSQGRFLGTDPAYEQYDEELIEALGLPFAVDYSGSDAATRSEVEAATAAGEPILLYWWTPTALVAGNDLVEVALPERTEACLTDFEAGGPLACDYPIDRLFKLGSPELIDKAPEVHRFLASFTLTTDDQLDLLDRVDNQGVPVERAASEWIEANEGRWQAWLE